MNKGLINVVYVILNYIFNNELGGFAFPPQISKSSHYSRLFIQTSFQKLDSRFKKAINDSTQQDDLRSWCHQHGIDLSSSFPPPLR